MKRGFTLIELMIVVVIVGILAAVAIPACMEFMGKKDSETSQQDEVEIDEPVVEM